MSRLHSSLENALAKRTRSGGAAPDRPPIVVIDDDEPSRRSLAFALGDRYNVILCGSGREGVAAVHEDICAVILDVRMPEQDGFSVCTEIRSRIPEVPIIFYSAYQNAKDPYEIINDHHPFGYVAKGDDLQKLVKLVDMAVRLQSIIVYNRKLIRQLKSKQDPAR